MSSAEAKMCLNSNRWQIEETVQVLAAKPPKPTTPPIALSGANTFVFCEVCAVNQVIYFIILVLFLKFGTEFIPKENQ